MGVYIKQMISGFQVTFNPHLFLSLGWKEAATIIMVMMFVIPVCMIWLLKRSGAPRKVYVFPVILTVLVFVSMILGIKRLVTDGNDLYTLRFLEWLFVLRYVVLLACGLMIGSGLRKRPIYLVFLLGGVVCGILLNLVTQHKVALGILAVPIMIFDAYIISQVFLDILEYRWFEYSDELATPIRLAIMMFVLMCLTVTLMSVGDLSERVLEADQREGIRWTDAATGEEIPPVSLVKLITGSGIIKWILPTGILLGFVTRIPGRFTG